MPRTRSEASQARARRHARNQLLSRQVNEQIAQCRYSASFGEFMCECGMKTCVAALPLKPEEFAAIRQQAGRFVVLPGHVSRCHERIVEQNSRYVVVETVAVPEVQGAMRQTMQEVAGLAARR